MRPWFGICVTSLEGIFMCDIQIDSRMGAGHQNCSSQTFNICYANYTSEIICDLFTLYRFFENTFYSFYDMIYLLTAVGLPPGGSSTVHIYTQTVHRTTQNKQFIEKHKKF
jgi:hypothetical protein